MDRGWDSLQVMIVCFTLHCWIKGLFAMIGRSAELLERALKAHRYLFNNRLQGARQ